MELCGRIVVLHSQTLLDTEDLVSVMRRPAVTRAVSATLPCGPASTSATRSPPLGPARRTHSGMPGAGRRIRRQPSRLDNLGYDSTRT